MKQITPAEKAKELYTKYERLFIGANADSWTKEAKQCALISIEDLIVVARNSDKVITDLIGLLPLADRIYFKDADKSKAETFWVKVRDEINKL